MWLPFGYHFLVGGIIFFSGIVLYHFLTEKDVKRYDGLSSVLFCLAAFCFYFIGTGIWQLLAIWSDQ